MRVLGIVAEYNPFHNGHLYHLEQSLKITDATHSVAVMSGNFMQRGEPSIVNKWARAEMAVSAGIDLVIELPVVYACRSAESFALGAVNIMDGIGVVDCICFGSETGDIAELKSISDILVNEPWDFKLHLKRFLSEGLSYPSARALALEKYMETSAGTLHNLIKSPNNILAVEYLKAVQRLGSRIQCYTLKRFAAGYHSVKTNGRIASATAIRNQLLNNNAINLRIEKTVPRAALNILKRELTLGRGPVHNDLFSLPVIGEIRRHEAVGLKKYPGVTEGLENRIWNAARKNRTISRMLDQIKSKRYTHTRLRRISTYILLGIYQDLLLQLEGLNYPCYARVLALNERGREVLKKAGRLSRIPIITKTSNHSFPEGSPLPGIFRKDILATDMYVMAYVNGDYSYAGQDFLTSPFYL